MFSFDIKYCPYCGQEMDYIAGTCFDCGEKLVDGANYCHMCGTDAEDDLKCRHCREWLTEEDWEAIERIKDLSASERLQFAQNYSAEQKRIKAEKQALAKKELELNLARFKAKLKAIRDKNAQLKK